MTFGFVCTNRIARRTRFVFPHSDAQSPILALRACAGALRFAPGEPNRRDRENRHKSSFARGVE
jgi:hypothetical protein